MSNHSPSFVLRNYPDDDALVHPHDHPKAVSFSPDIIPLYGKTADKSTLLDSASWRGFTGLPIVGGDVNNVYIRGYGTGGPYVATLRVIPSELILWPNVWYNVQPVASGPVMIPEGDSQGRSISDGPFQFRPPHTTGSSYSLIVNVIKYEDEHKDLQPPPPFHLEHVSVDEFIKFLSRDGSFTFYNVIVADPTLKHIPATTRLRMLGDLHVPVTFGLEWHKGTSVPPGLEVSLVDDRGRISITRTSFSSFVEHAPVWLEPCYDGILMLNVFAPAENGLFEPYAGFSLKVFKAKLLPTDSTPLLGALNVIFEPHSTRNLRFAGPAAVRLREAKNTHEKAALDAPKSKDFRISHILPVGTELNKNYATILQSPAEDYSIVKNPDLSGNQNNYIFLRGHGAITDIDVQSRLFAVGIGAVNYPSHYVQHGLKVLGKTGADESINEESITVDNADESYLFERPFYISNAPEHSAKHYCLIGELRQKHTRCPVWPGWPCEDRDNFATLADFENWCLSSPPAWWRNINWEPCLPGKKYSEWSCKTQLCIPECSSYSSFWTIIIECENADIPQDSTWGLLCDDNAVFPNGTCFDTRSLDNQSPASRFAGCHFTGAYAKYTANLTLTVRWCDGGGSNIPPPSIKWRLALTETVVSPILHLALCAPSGSEAWPLYVTKDYPYIGKDWNPSPLPSFDHAGTNTWPFKDALQFSLGEVSLGGKRN